MVPHIDPKMLSASLQVVVVLLRMLAPEYTEELVLFRV